MTQKIATAIGVDMGGTKIQAALVRLAADREGGEVWKTLAVSDKLKYQELLAVKGAKRLKNDEVVARLTQGIVGLLRGLKAHGQADVIGVASAGFIEGREILEAQNIGFQRFPVCDALEKETGLKTVLMKDSWAPVHAANISEPTIIFSLGTGFGGVCCQGDRSLPLLSYTENNRLAWIPCLMMNDDPGYACCFNWAECLSIASAAMERCPLGKELDFDVETLMQKLWSLAAEEKKKTPAGFMRAVARLLAPNMYTKLKKEAVFADFFGSAAFVPKVHLCLTGRNAAPPELDAAIDREPEASFAFTLHAGFVAAMLNEMQMERDLAGLTPAVRILGAGSGFNPANCASLSEKILSFHWHKPIYKPSMIELLPEPEAGLTIACLGAALGAGRGLTA